MSSEIIIALIGACGSIVGSIIGILSCSKMWTYRIEQLEKKQDKHNSVIERTYKLEQQMAVQEEILKELKDKVGA